MKIFAVCDGDGVTQGEILPNNSVPAGWTTVQVSGPAGLATTIRTYCPKCFATIIFPTASVPVPTPLPVVA